MISEPVEDPVVEEKPVEQVSKVAEAARDVFPEQDNSVSEDSVLDRLLGIDAPEPRREVPSPEPSAPAPDPEMDRALKALQRDGVPVSVIEGMKTDPSALKEWGLKAAKRQSDVDSFGSKVAEERKKAESREDREKPKAEEPKASSEVDSEDDADPLSKFSSLFGEEATKPIRTITEKMRSEFDERARMLEVKYETQSAYERVAREYGREAPSFDDISEVAAQIGRENPGAFSSVSEIIGEAFRRRAGEPKRADPRNSARPTVGKQPSRPVRQIDREDAVLDVLLSGGSRADALKIATR